MKKTITNEKIWSKKIYSATVFEKDFPIVAMNAKHSRKNQLFISEGVCYFVRYYGPNPYDFEFRVAR